MPKGQTPEYEVWGSNWNSLSGFDNGPMEFLEDCWTIQEAKQAQLNFEASGFVTEIREKETGNKVQ